MQLAQLAERHPRWRRLFQATLFELIAIAVVAPTLAWLFAHPPLSAMALSAAMSAIALAWNYGFNTVYERWERLQRVKGRSFTRRLVHGALFEAGLTLVLVPLMAVWLQVTLLEALLADIGLLAFFFAYTMGFTWAFDHVFGLPLSARLSPDGQRAT